MFVSRQKNHAKNTSALHSRGWSESGTDERYLFINIRRIQSWTASYEVIVTLQRVRVEMISGFNCVKNLDIDLFICSYPTRDIYMPFNEFFATYSIISTAITPMIHDENEFQFLRHQLMKQATMHEHRRAARLLWSSNICGSYDGD